MAKKKDSYEEVIVEYVKEVMLLKVKENEPIEKNALKKEILDALDDLLTEVLA